MSGKATNRSSSSSLRKRKRRGRCRPPRAVVLHRRKRWGRWPQPPQKGKYQVPHARNAPYLRGLDDGELTAIIVSSRAWQETIKAYCDELDSRKHDSGPDPIYAAWEYEAFLTFQRVCGYRDFAAAHRRATGDGGSSFRYLIGLDYPRDPLREVRPRKYQLGKAYRRTMDGVPSTSAMSRHRERIDEETSLRLWCECLRRLIRDHIIEFPDFAAEAALAGIDGIVAKSIHTAALYHKKTGEVTNASRITKDFEGGANMGKDLPRSKRTRGGYLVVVPATLASRCVLGVPHVEACPGAESPAGRRLIERELEQNVKPYVNWDAPGVIVMDGAYFALLNFRAAYRAGYIPQIHNVAHPRGGLKALGLNPDGTSTEAEEPDDDELSGDASVEHMLREDVELVDIPPKFTKTRDNYLDQLDTQWPVKGSPGWYVNGLREVWCIHGVQATSARAGLRADGSATSAVVGRCDTCGPICITAGTKRVASGMVVDVLTDDPAAVAEADWSIGNPLTYNNPKAQAYGAARFANLEGLLGNVKSRYNVFTSRNRCLRLNQMKLMVVQTFAIQHAIAMHYRRCLQADQDGLAIPQPLPVPGSIHDGEDPALAEAA